MAIEDLFLIFEIINVTVNLVVDKDDSPSFV